MTDTQGSSNNFTSNYIENSNINLKSSGTIGISVVSNNNFFLRDTIINEYTGVKLGTSYGNVF